jgi:hypothetical protein
MTTFLGRPLTAQEEAWHADGRCIACHAKVEQTSNGFFRMECTECYRARTNVSAPTSERNLGACRASIHHELCRRMGYSNNGGSGPGSDDDA